MQGTFLKRAVTTILVVTVVGLIAFFIVGFLKGSKDTLIEDTKIEEATVFTKKIIGKSVEGRNIEVYTYGNGEKHLMLVGGVHGGYEWNSTLLAYEFIDYLKDNPTIIPSSLTVSIIPSLNPDGLFRIIKKDGKFTLSDTPKVKDTTGLGRFNANNVDLNRNFNCKWKPESMWKGNVVSAGTFAFSEPEAIALRDFVLKNDPEAVVFWHSQANAVYASECENGILTGTRNIMNAYSKASGYKAVDVFDSYEITGDAEGWLASIGIPAITVELSTHETIEWDRNLAGVKAIFELFKI